MASPLLAAGKGSGTGAAAPGRIPPFPTSVEVFGVAGKGGMEWPIPTCVPAQCCHLSPPPCLGATERLPCLHLSPKPIKRFTCSVLHLSASLIISGNSAGPVSKRDCSQGGMGTSHVLFSASLVSPLPSRGRAVAEGGGGG